MSPRLAGRGNNRAQAQFARLLESASPAVAGDASIASMMLVASALRTAGDHAAPAAPDPAFRAALRQRLVAVAAVQAVEPAITLGRGRNGARTAVAYRAQRRVAALAGSVAIVTSLVGVGVAASRSLPGDPFYGVKRATEGVQLWTASGNLGKGRRHLEFARTRLAEAQALPPTSSHLASTLAAMNSQTTDGTHDLIAAYMSSKSLVPLADLEIFSREQIAGLQRLAPTLPVALRSTDTQSIQLLTGVVNTVEKVSNHACVLCVVSPGGSVLPPLRHSTSPSPGQHTVGPVTKPTPLPNNSRLNGSPPNPVTVPTSGATNHSHPSLPSGLPTILPTKLPTILPTVLPLPTSLLPTVLPTSVHHHKHPLPTLPPLPIVSSLLPGL
ncbi:MAG TPA: DUF5667 domain-containing protein [Mycobacteriales bacterium]|jgi:hypothetical protein|nr:DUF5667 domain-containing protein [Mycobacteriales bacterium]